MNEDQIRVLMMEVENFLEEEGDHTTYRVVLEEFINWLRDRSPEAVKARLIKTIEGKAAVDDFFENIKG